MWKKAKVTDATATGHPVDASEGVHLDDKGIKRKSKVPGVMITQFMEELPEGMSAPDFTRKPIAQTLQEGKFAVFKAKVVGTPTPKVTWSRANGEIHFHPEVCVEKYNEASQEHTIEFPKVCPEDADTYKCYATNEYGRAVTTVVLNVIEVGFSISRELQKKHDEVNLLEVTNIRKKLKKRNPHATESKPMDLAEKVWEILLSADKKDYERICAEYGITDFRGMLRKLSEMKKEREEEMAQFVSHIGSLKHIEVQDKDCATIELDFELKDPNSKIYLYKDGVMIPYGREESETMKHCLKQVGKKYIFTIKKLASDDAGLYSVDVEGVNIFSTDLKVPEVDFAVKIREVKAMEREDALFQCVLTAPMDDIKWSGKNAPLSKSDKYDILASGDKLIHKLIIRDCLPLDTGIYTALVGIKSCNAWLIVEADKNAAEKSKKAARKTTMAGGGDDDELKKIAKVQQENYQKKMAEKKEIAMKAKAERDAEEAAAHAKAEAAKKEAAEAKAAAIAAAKAAKAKRAAEEKAKAVKEISAAAEVADVEDAEVADDADSDKDGHVASADQTRTAKAKVATGAKGKARAEDAAAAKVTARAEGAVEVEEIAAGKSAATVEGAAEVKGAAKSESAHRVKGKAKGEGKVKVKRSAKDKGVKAKAKSAGAATGESAHVVKEKGEVAATGESAHVVKEKAKDEDAPTGEGAPEVKDTATEAATDKGTVGSDGGEDLGEDSEEEEEDDSFEDSEGESEGEDQGSRERREDIKHVKEGELPKTGGDVEEESEDEEDEKSGKKEKRQKKIVEVEEVIVDPGVHFHAGLSDCKVIIGEAALLQCKLSSEECEGIWYKDGEEITPSEAIAISKEGSYHKLTIHKVTEEDAGKYKFEADGRKTEAMIVVEDPPRFEEEELKAFKSPVTVKKGQKASFSLNYTGQEPIKIQWYLDSEELSDQSNIRLEYSEGSTHLHLTKLQRKDSGEIKIKLKNDFGTVEAYSQLVVMDKPTPPMGPVEVVEATSSAISFKWRPPKDSGGCKIGNYILERQQVGRNTWKKVGPIGPEAKYKDTDVDHGRKYCYRIRVETQMGTSEQMETDDIQAGTKAYPGPPSAPRVVSAFKDCINLSWAPPANTGGTNILGYHLEKRKKGSNLWIPVNPPEEMIKAKGFAVKDVVEGIEYEFRVSAINHSGAGEFSAPSEFVFARDPQKPPGKVLELKVTDSTYTTLSLAWNKPKEIEGVEDEAKGYFVEIRPAENTEWDRCNTNPITMTSYTVKGLKSMAMYWVRVIATNDGGEGEIQELDNYILAMPPPVRPRLTDAKIKSFVVVRAGNSARFNINFEASPWPDITWQKDGGPVSKKVTISNTEGTSQLLIPSAERSDTGIYTIIVKNIVGQEMFSIEIRVTDEPKPPGPVEVDENVPGTVTISWSPSPDEKRDDRLHYMVMKRDSSKRQWHPIGDHIFNNRFTACNIMPGREYLFRVYAKNDMGSSEPSESPKWMIYSKKEKFTVKIPERKICNLQCPPRFIVPLKMHTAPKGYECYMSCAIRGDPMPHVTWLRNNISLNTNTNYLITNTCGVCSMLILRVGPKDTGEYKVVAENTLGRAECATKLTVRE